MARKKVRFKPVSGRKAVFEGVRAAQAGAVEARIKAPQAKRIPRVTMRNSTQRLVSKNCTPCQHRQKLYNLQSRISLVLIVEI